MSVVIDGTSGITTPAETVQGALTTTGNTILGDATTDTLTVGVTGIVKDASGNVGIGVSPNAAVILDVKEPDAAQDAIFRLAPGTGAAIQIRAIAQVDGTTSAMSFYTVAGSSSDERMRITSPGLLQFNSGYGSVATAYGCRAWVNFDGTAASPITARASANISSITKASTSDYTINFTTALVDANYSIVAVVSPLAGYGGINVVQLNSARASTTIVAPTTSAFVLSVVNASSGVGAASAYVNVAVFR